MKVLFINSVCGIGSTGRIVQHLSETVNKNGGISLIACGRKAVGDRKKIIRIGNHFSVFFHAFMSRIFDTCGFHSKIATLRLINKIKKFSPDIINLHNLHGYYINIEILFRYLKNNFSGRVIWTLHDCWAFTGHCTHYSYIKCDKWKRQCHDCPQKRRYPSSFLFDRSSLNYLKKKSAFTGLKNMLIVTPSKWLADEVCKSFLREYKVKVINNGIDLSIFKPSEESNKHKNILLNVSDGFDERKGIHDLFKIISLLPPKYSLVVIGVKSKKEYPRIRFIGRVNSQKQLADFYSSADFLINPTHEDTFPTINIESLACGTPVLTYNVGGSPESISAKCGAAVKEGDVESMKNIVLASAFDRDECVKRASLFDREKKYQEYYNLFLESLK